MLIAYSQIGVSNEQHIITLQAHRAKHSYFIAALFFRLPSTTEAKNHLERLHHAIVPYSLDNSTLTEVKAHQGKDQPLHDAFFLLSSF